ncbi:hypothetical protein LNV09_09680 [Paucibacter sp. B2R-40]|uniref:hypothetical protein n=1 Tax=Paucibacter sp. B2R-40 TaxID=2893554 RepID=UPI0021E37C06|nr:hypothetical protein [Paucibacter sp. B2R-40]MCV2354430.1 hypothetical protein [Paucibacter sp. B2R-40]
MDRCPALIFQSAAWAKFGGARLICGVLALSSWSAAQGLEIGAVQMLSGLGQPLSLQLPVRWAPGEARSLNCLRLAVDAGDSRLAGSDVQQSLLKGADAASALIWVRSKLVMQEPVLVLSLGCPAQQVMALVDPVHSMTPPAGGFKLVSGEPAAIDQFNLPGEAARPARAHKLRSEQRAARPRSLLRLGDASLPPLTMMDAETPGLRWRFDSDLDGSATLALSSRKPLKAAKEQPFYVRPDAPGASLLMSIDVGRAAGPADLLMAQDGPARLQRAQAQFSALQADHQALKLEMEQLEAKLAARDSAQNWLNTLIAGIAVAVVAAAFFFVRRRRSV